MLSVKGVQMFGLDQPFGFYFLDVCDFLLCVSFGFFCSVLRLLDLNEAISFKLE